MALQINSKYKAKIGTLITGKKIKVLSEKVIGQKFS